jgi:hypothetical protein
MNNYAERIIAVGIINTLRSDNECLHDKIVLVNENRVLVTHWT